MLCVYDIIVRDRSPAPNSPSVDGSTRLHLSPAAADFIPTPDLMYGAQSSLGVMYCFVLAAHELHTAAQARPGT